MKKIGIIGSGDVAKALAKGFLTNGYDVCMGSRSKEKELSLREEIGKELGEELETGTFSDAARFGELLVLAVKGKAAEEALHMAGEAQLKGKTIIDVTNPIDDSRPPENGVLHYFTTLEESLHERLQKKFPQGNFVKAFNSVGNAHMVNPDFGEITPTMFICGNSDSAKKEVRFILDQFGWETADFGKATSARAIEPLCILWCIPGMLQNDWNHAFKLLKK